MLTERYRACNIAREHSLFIPRRSSHVLTDSRYEERIDTQSFNLKHLFSRHLEPYKGHLVISRTLLDS
jgi:hypothetical protein